MSSPRRQPSRTTFGSNASLLQPSRQPLRRQEAGLAGIISQEILGRPPESLRANLELMLGEFRDKLPAGARQDELMERLRAEAPQRALQAALSLIHGGADAN